MTEQIDGRLQDTRALPHLGNAGQGINRELPHLGNAGRGDERLVSYMQSLAERLRRVRITCGSWERVLKPSVTRSSAGGDGATAILLDPPYATSGDLYAGTADAQARACLTEALRPAPTPGPLDGQEPLIGEPS